MRTAYSQGFNDNPILRQNNHYQQAWRLNHVRFSPQIICLILILVLITTPLAGCIGARRTPNLARIFADARVRTGKRPIIFIPGILGSELVNQKTGEVAWPSVLRLSNDDLTLPMTPDLAANRDDLVATKIVNAINLGRIVPEVYIYRELLDALSKYGGYHEGDWENPPADGDRDTFYVFPYDWRRDNVETACTLFHRIEALKIKLNRPDLRFNIIAHSMGGLVARYMLRYGGADLPPEGVRPRPTWAGAAHINKIIMFGTPNEGSMDSFATLLDGYSVTEGLRRPLRLLNKLSREDALSAPAIFQLLPHASVARFLDENLQPLDLNFYDPATWRKYGWAAVNDENYRRDYPARGIGKNSFKGGALSELDAYFAAVLERAKRFHEALDVIAEPNTTVSLSVFGGDCEETLNAAVILRDGKTGRWMTLTRARSFRNSQNRLIKRSEVIRAMYAPGDGRVTRRSLLAEDFATETHGLNSLFNAGLPISYAVFACDLHGDLQNNKTLQDNALTILVSEAMK